jgi:hypothetical protein
VEIRFPRSTTEYFLVKPQTIDNLPDHIKQADGLPAESKLGTEWDRTQKVYKAQITYEDHTGTVTGTVPVEFITNTRANADNWYCLIANNTEQGITYTTNQELLLGFNHGLGWWDKFDTRHPDYNKA